MHLFGRYPSDGTGPGGPADCSLYHKLEAIAGCVVPKEIRPTRYEIGPDPVSFHYRSESGRVPEVQLTLRIVHRTGYFRPIDACEIRCAEEIQTNLRSLGCPPNRWVLVDHA